GAPLEPRPRPAVELAGKPVPGAPTRSSEFALVVVGCPLRRAPQRTPKPWPEFAQVQLNVDMDAAQRRGDSGSPSRVGPRSPASPATCRDLTARAHCDRGLTERVFRRLQRLHEQGAIGLSPGPEFLIGRHVTA